MKSSKIMKKKMKYIGEDNDGNSIKCDPESEKFEEKYKKNC